MLSPCREFVVQSMVGLKVLNHGCPRITRSRPRLVTKNRDREVFFPHRVQRSQYWVMVPTWFGVPSTFRTRRGCDRVRVPNPSDFTALLSMKLWVALVTFLPWTGPDCVLTGYDYSPRFIISHGLTIRRRITCMILTHS